MNYKKFAPILFAAAFLVVGSGCGDQERLENEQAYRKTGLEQLDKGDFEGAIRSFDQALGERVGIVSNLEEDINLYKAYAQIEAGRTEEAIETYHALVAYNDSNANAYYLRGCAYISLGNTQAAVSDFKQAAKHDPGNGELYACIYERLVSVGLSAQAEEYLEKGLENNGDSAAACLSRGRLYLAGGDYKNAELELRDALSQKEERANLYLGGALKAQEKYDEAKACYEAYAKKNPEDTKVLYELGEIAFIQSDYEQALAYFEQGLAGASLTNKRDLWAGKIKALEFSGDFKAAKKEISAYRKDYPADELAKREHIFLKTRVK